jgi:hypothetical protein
MTIDTTNPTPTQIEKAALFFDILQDARNAGKGWWASSQYRQIEMAVEQDKKIAALLTALDDAKSWIEQWESDVWAGLAPTTESLIATRLRVAAAAKAART